LLDQDIGTQLRSARQRAGISQQALGEAVGVTFQQI
jgi:transcriptional regulator with XRE-family HTH domain